MLAFRTSVSSSLESSWLRSARHFSMTPFSFYIDQSIICLKALTDSWLRT